MTVTSSRLKPCLKCFVITTEQIHIGNRMMSTDHPITPPPELVKQWWKEAQQADYSDGLPCWLTYVATQAARWGSLQELEGANG